MRHDILLSAVLASLLALPVTAYAQGDPASDALETLERGLLERLCAVDRGDEVALAACLVASAAVVGGDVLLEMPSEANSETGAGDPSATTSAEPGGVLERARQAAEEALSSAQRTAGDIDVREVVEQAVVAAQARVAGVDVGAAFDQVIDAARDVDLDAAIDAAITAADDVDVQAAVADAIARAQDLDLRAALVEAAARMNESVGPVGDVDLTAWLEEGVRTTRSIVAETRQWAQENADVVCAGSGLSTAAAAAAVVAYLTGSPGLALRAFEESEPLATDICLRVTVPSEAEASPAHG